MEAEYGYDVYDETSALSFYDCLVPKIKSQRRLIRKKDYKDTIIDRREMAKEIAEAEKAYNDLYSKNIDLRQMKEENDKLRHENENMKLIDDLIRFYTKNMEKGLNAEDLLRQNNELKKKFKTLKT